MAFQYQHILVIGATSGIGKAMAERFIAAGRKVTVVGRRTERLDEFVKKHGVDKVESISFDIGELEKIPQFAAQVMKQSPDIDCIYLNAGIPGASDFSKPDTVHLEKFNHEVKINFTSQVNLVHAFTPYLLAKKEHTSFMFTGTGLAIIPFSISPSYSASKAALNAFVVCLRTQLLSTNITVIDIITPPVQTEFHKDPNFGMPVIEFAEKVWEDLQTGKDEIVIGTVVSVPPETLNDIIKKRRAASEGIDEFVRKMTKSVVRGHD